MASSQSTSLQLIIRTANNKYSDFNLQLPSTTTVWQLKEHVTLTHPTKPVPEDQRLIFAGKLLDDQMVLQQVLTKSSSAASTYTIHLVLQADRNQSPVRNVSTPSTTPKPTEQPPSAAPRSSAYEQYLSQLNEYQQRLEQFVSSPNGMPSGWDVHSQVYLQYCQTHYQMYQNLLAYQRANGAPAAATTVVPPSSATAPPPPPVPPVVNAPPANNNNNNNPNNEFEQENDLLGVLNMLAELFVLCSIIYFYSTFNRFLVVFVLFSLLYLHYRGYLSFQRRRRVVNPPAPPAAAPANEAEPLVRDDEPDAEPNRPEAPAPTANPSDEAPVTATRLFVTAVSTFFSSLIPERPPRT